MGFDMGIANKTPQGAIILALSLSCACSSSRESAEGPRTAGPYLNQDLPGDTAVLFAPGLVSVEGRYEYGVSFSPDGREVLVTVQPPEGRSGLVRFRAEDRGWVGPEAVRLAGGRKAEEMEAFFTPDGRRIYFAAYDEGMDVRIWAVGRGQEGTSSAWQLGPPMGDVPAFYPTTTSDGTVYYSNLAERRIFRARVVGDSVGPAEDTGINAMHSFVAPDESFVLVDARVGAEGAEADVFVTFRRPDGSWSDLVDLGPGVNSDYAETCPSLSPDGRFVFFSRFNEENGVSNVYWVRSTVVEAARRRVMPGSEPG